MSLTVNRPIAVSTSNITPDASGYRDLDSSTRMAYSAKTGATPDFGDSLKGVQNDLFNAGYYPGGTNYSTEIDGLYGPKTSGAVTKLQQDLKAAGLYSGDANGVVDASLGKALAQLKGRTLPAGLSADVTARLSKFTASAAVPPGPAVATTNTSTFVPRAQTRTVALTTPQTTPLQSTSTPQTITTPQTATRPRSATLSTDEIANLSQISNPAQRAEAELRLRLQKGEGHTPYTDQLLNSVSDPNARALYSRVMQSQTPPWQAPAGTKPLTAAQTAQIQSYSDPGQRAEAEVAARMQNGEGSSPHLNTLLNQIPLNRRLPYLNALDASTATHNALPLRPEQSAALSRVAPNQRAETEVMLRLQNGEGRSPSNDALINQIPDINRRMQLFNVMAANPANPRPAGTTAATTAPNGQITPDEANRRIDNVLNVLAAHVDVAALTQRLGHAPSEAEFTRAVADVANHLADQSSTPARLAAWGRGQLGFDPSQNSEQQIDRFLRSAAAVLIQSAAAE